MKKFLVFFLALIAASASLFAYGVDKIVLKNFDTVMTLAKYEQKRAIVVFSDPNCPYCIKLKSETLSNTDVQDMLANNFVIGEIYPTSQKATFQGNSYSYQDLFTGFGVKGTPTLVFFESDGKPITYLPGYAGPKDFTTILRYIALKKYADKTDFQAFASSKNTFSGTPKVVDLTKEEAEYVLSNDPLAVKINAVPSSGSDRHLKYVISGTGASAVARKMIGEGYYSVFVEK